MAGDDDFEKADSEAGTRAEVEVLPATRESALPADAKDVMSYRQQLVARYHSGAPSLVQKLKDIGKEDKESLLVAMIDEVVQETDHLLGNELVAAQNGDLRDSSVISFKRAEVLEKAIKAVQARQELDKKSGLDVDSPAMIIVFRFFMAKAKIVFERMQTSTEMSDLFFRMMGDETDNWKRELKEQFEQMKGSV